MTTNVIITILIILLPFRMADAQQSRSAHGEELYALARTDLKKFAQQVSKDATSELGRAQAIVRWLAENFEWKATDYQKRTVPDIIERRGGNCNELAMVALAAMKELGIKLRRVHEVNICTNTPDRGERAHKMVKEKGNSYSVFGRHHNDHIWLELYDSTANEWFPADPSSGLVGTEEWLKGRVWFGERHSLNPITNDMIVPIAIFAADESGKFLVNRTQHYLVDEFDRVYQGKLHMQPAWKQWTSMLDFLDDKVCGAFNGTINLHEQEAQIDSLATTYEQLRASIQMPAIFVFHTDEFWLNLHHFLYVLGRAQNKTRDASREAVLKAPTDQEQGLAKMTPDEKRVWNQAVAFYAEGPSRKDLVFDDSLPASTSALARAGDARSLAKDNIDPTMASTLERAAPIYRKVWWTQHRAANDKWRSETQTLLDKYGNAILSFITSKYGLEWAPTGYHVHLSGYTNWAGAYSTRGNLLVVSSLDEAIRAVYGLETIFHEGMHQWDDQVSQSLREKATHLGKVVPKDLSHAMIFFTAGEAVRRIFPDHIPYADKFGIWQRGLGPFKTALEHEWKPYLDGRVSRDEALAELIKQTGTER